MAKKVKLPGRVESADVDGIVTGAGEILDDEKGKVQSVINSEVDAELVRLENEKQNNITVDGVPTEGSGNPVSSGAVYTADKALSDAIEAILLLIPSAASVLNKLADVNYVQSAVATATAAFKGTYNLVSDLHLSVSASHSQIAAALDALSMGADANDYCYVQVPTSDQSSVIEKTERYKFNGTSWAYEYDLNNSGFTSDQWEAINSNITAMLVSKLIGLPTSEVLASLLASKQDSLTFDNTPTAGSNNPVKSSGIYARNNEIVALIDALDLSKQDYLTFDQSPVNGSTNPVTSGGVYDAIYLVQVALAGLDGRMLSAEHSIDVLTENVGILRTLYQALNQSDIIVGALPSTGVSNTVYRVPGTSTYADWMYYDGAWVKLAEYTTLDGYLYKGIATPSSSPAASADKMFYFALTAGTYTNFGNIIVTEGISILKYDGANWSQDKISYMDGGVFDVTAYSGSSFASLDALLSDANLNNLIPSTVRKGGMSIKFVHTPDNKYVRYNYIGTSTANSDFTNVTNWERVSDELFAPLGTFSRFNNGYINNQGNPEGSSDGITVYSTEFLEVAPNTDYQVVFKDSSYKLGTALFDANGDFIKLQRWFIDGTVFNSENAHKVVIMVRKLSGLTKDTIVGPVFVVETQENINEFKEKSEIMLDAIQKSLIPISGKVSIIGDSISTYAGTLPSGYVTYYPLGNITSIYDMWWQKILSLTGATLEVNASCTGSAAGERTGYPDFYDRTGSGFLGNPDYIFVALGTNDQVNGIPLGTFDYEASISSLSETSFIPAYTKGVKSLIANYPAAKIVLFIFHMNSVYADAIEQIGKHFGLPVIDVRSYYINNIHPDKDGMITVAQDITYFYLNDKIDTEPKTGSRNPVESGGVDKSIYDIYKNIGPITSNSVQASSNPSSVDWKYIDAFIPAGSNAYIELQTTVAPSKYTNIAFYNGSTQLGITKIFRVGETKMYFSIEPQNVDITRVRILLDKQDNNGATWTCNTYNIKDVIYRDENTQTIDLSTFTVYSASNYYKYILPTDRSSFDISLANIPDGYVLCIGSASTLENAKSNVNIWQSNQYVITGTTFSKHFESTEEVGPFFVLTLKKINNTVLSNADKQSLSAVTGTISFAPLLSFDIEDNKNKSDIETVSSKLEAVTVNKDAFDLYNGSYGLRAWFIHHREYANATVSVSNIPSGFDVLVNTYYTLTDAVDGINPVYMTGWITGVSSLERNTDRYENVKYLCVGFKKTDNSKFTTSDLASISQISITAEYKENFVKQLDFQELDSRMTDSLLTYYPALYSPVLYAHLFMDGIFNHSNPVIPSQSLHDVRVTAALGFKMIELNVLKTQDNVYICRHQVGAGIFQGLLNSSDEVVSVDIPHTTYSDLKSNYRYNSQFPQFQTSVVTLEETLIEVKKYGMIPLLTLDSGIKPIVEKIFGKRYVGYKSTFTRSDDENGITLFMPGNDGLHYTVQQHKDVIDTVGAPLIYGLGAQDVFDFTDAELKEIIEYAHNKGVSMYFAAMYIEEDKNQKFLNLGFDVFGSGWTVPDFEYGDKLNVCGNTLCGFSNYTLSSGVDVNTDGSLSLSSGDTVSVQATDSMIIGKESLEITFAGSLKVVNLGRYRLLDNTVYNSIEPTTIKLSNILENAAGVFSIGTDSSLTVYGLNFKVSEVW